MGINNNPYNDTNQQWVEHLLTVLNEFLRVDGDTLEHYTCIKNLSMGIPY